MNIYSRSYFQRRKKGGRERKEREERGKKRERERESIDTFTIFVLMKIFTRFYTAQSSFRYSTQALFFGTWVKQLILSKTVRMNFKM